MNDITALPPRKKRDYLRVEYTRKRDVEHLRRCLAISREMGYADTLHELLLRCAHLARTAKEQEDAMYREELKQVKKVKKSTNTSGEALCELLGGTVDKENCKYKKYEVGVGNKRLVWDRITPLCDLKEDIHVRNQYVPSLEAWEKAN